MADVVDLTDEPEAKRQDLSKAPPKLGDDLLDLVYKQLPLREKMRAARVNKGRQTIPYSRGNKGDT